MVPLRLGGCALQVDPRRDEGDLHAGPARRRSDARPRRARHRHDRHGDRVQRLVGPDRESQERTWSRQRRRSITGTPSSQGGKLEVAGGSWNLTPTAFTYQWQRCNVNGRLCAAIPGAIGSSYTPTAGDVGYRLLAVVQAVANGLPQATLSTTTTAVS